MSSWLHKLNISRKLTLVLVLDSLPDKMTFHKVFVSAKYWKDPVSNLVCDRIWENPAYGINAQFTQCAFLVCQVKNYGSPDFVISMSKNLSVTIIYGG